MKTLFSLWQKGMGNSDLSDPVVLVSDGETGVVTFMPDEVFFGMYRPVYGDAVEVTRHLASIKVTWILVNAPDDVAAACGVPTE